MVQPFVYLLLLIDVALTVAAQLSLRAGAVRLAGRELSLGIIFEPLKNVYLFAGIVLYAVSFFLYVFILSRLQLNVAYPIATGAMLVLITGASHFLLRETITTLQIAGIAAILFGIVLVLASR